MKVFYDSTIFSFQVFGGISHYFAELMNHLPSEWGYSLSVRASENEYLKLLHKKRFTIPLRHVPDHKKLSSFINRFYDRRILRKGDLDIFHPTDYSGYFQKYLNRPYVITVHDMQFLNYVREGVFSKEYGDVIRTAILKADGIIAISNATRNSLLSSMDIDPGKVEVIYHGFSPDFTHCETRPAWLPEKYILFVGQRGNYKNFNVLLESFQLMVRQDPELKILCTGRHFSKAEKTIFEKISLSDRIIHRFVDQKEMAAAYKYAQCFVFPSKMEGFGMPILEAFAADCPVVLSNASCLPEIAGSGALYFNPDDPQELASRIESVISDSSLRHEIIKNGQNRLLDFSWKKCGQETARFYEKTLGRV